MPKLVADFPAYALGQENLGVDQRLDRRDHLPDALLQDVGEEYRGEGTTDTRRGLYDGSGTRTPIEPLGHEFREEKRDIRRFADGMRRLDVFVDQGEHELLDKERNALGGSDRLRDLFGRQ